jgi:hypothetical protein
MPAMHNFSSLSWHNFHKELRRPDNLTATNFIVVVKASGSQ